jgi:hypothetical protein
VTAWTAEQVPTAVTPGAVTMIEGTAFCVCGPSGDILPGGTDGIYFRDTRLVAAACPPGPPKPCTAATRSSRAGFGCRAVVPSRYHGPHE